MILTYKAQWKATSHHTLEFSLSLSLLFHSVFIAQLRYSDPCVSRQFILILHGHTEGGGKLAWNNNENGTHRFHCGTSGSVGNNTLLCSDTTFGLLYCCVLCVCVTICRLAFCVQLAIRCTCGHTVCHTRLICIRLGLKQRAPVSEDILQCFFSFDPKRR